MLEGAVRGAALKAMISNPAACHTLRHSRLLVAAVWAFASANDACAGPLPPSYVETGVCPFECCQFGQWVIRSPIPVYARRGETRPAKFKLSPGDTVRAETGDLVIDRVGRVVVDETVGEFSRGDTLIALHCGREEGFLVWKDGDFHYTDIFWPMLETGEAPNTQPSAKPYAGRMIERPRMTWWVRISTAGGMTGWIPLRNTATYCYEFGDKIDGMDACK